MSEVHERECKAAGLDPKRVASIARRLSRAAKDASDLGLWIFGGNGVGTLRRYPMLGARAYIVAQLDGRFDGGDGSCETDSDGLLRGE